MSRLQILATADGGYRWRLLGDNYRALAASATDFVDRSACLRHVRLAARVATEYAPQPQRHAGGYWGWVLADQDGTPVARSVADYTRRAECDKAIDRFLMAFRSASVAVDDAR
jgi:uncharacterized protein YegP (UPF0339 family)